MIAVVIVNYGTPDLAADAVESVLARAHGGRTVELHLLDNGSPPEAARAMADIVQDRGWGPRVVFHQETENHGFGRGNNLVFDRLSARADPPDKVFLLNPDARLGNEAIAVLADYLDVHPEVGVAGARIEKPGTGPVTAAFRFPSIASVFADAVAFGPISGLFDRWRVPLAPDIPTGPVDWVAGAAMMARFDLIREMGGFDPEFFLYFEEVELMRRIAARGWQTHYVKDALVIHAEGAATGVRSGAPRRRRRPSYWYHSWQHFFRKTHGRPYALAAALAWSGGAVVNRVIATVLRRERSGPTHFFGDFWAAAVRPLLGLEARSRV